MTFTADDAWLLLRTLGGVALVLLFLRWYEPRMIYYPHVPTRRLERTPADVGMGYETVSLTASDGVRLHGWFLPGPTPDAPALLYCHGNAGNVSHRLEKCRVFHDVGLAVLAFDYRGYGESEGKPNERGIYRDADSAYEYLTQTRGADPRLVLVYGESLGSGVAVDLAARAPVGGVILEAAFTSLADVGQRIFWFLPGLIRPLVRDRYDSLAKVGRVDAPLLLLHSREDEIFRCRPHAERLHAAARGPKRLVALRGSHAGAFFASETTCREALRDFVAESGAGAGAATRD